MNTVLGSSSNRNIGQQVGNELSNICLGATNASPRDHLEVGAQVLGFTGELGDSAVPDQLDAPYLQASAGRSGQIAPGQRVGNQAHIMYVSREPKHSLRSLGAKETLPPDSIEWQRLITRRIGYMSAAFALTLTASWLAWIIRGFPRTEPDWMTGLALALLILPAFYGVSFLVFDAVYGMLSGATRRARKYMDQVYPPSKKREW